MRLIETGMTYNRFIALGDSMTEGMQDEIINGLYRGWADRVADVMAESYENFTYANLAVRGKLVGQVHREQVPIAVGMVNGASTIISFHAGANDVIRPKYDPAKTIDTYNDAVDQIIKSGATLMLFCVLEDTGKRNKTAQIWQERFNTFNDNVRKKANSVGAILFDPNQDIFWRDSRFIHEDRLHLNSEGHRRVAQAVLARLNLPHDPDWRKPLPDASPQSILEKTQINLHWFGAYAVPWMIRRARRRSSGDGRSAKYPAPITWK
jgi:lysophospholipase L1-like esterase